MSDIDTYHNYERIAQVDGLDHFRAFATEAEKKKRAVLENVMESPEISDTDITRDIRYQLGFAAGISWALSLPERCREQINSSLQRG